MKNNDYYNYEKSINDLTTVLSIGYFFKYSFKVIQKRIIESKYFSHINNEFSYISTADLVANIYFDAEISDEILNITYPEFEWIAMFYLHLISSTNLNFETIFIYAPITKAVEMFKIYHELDLNQALIWFNEEREKASIIKIRMQDLKLSSKDVGEFSGLSSYMILSLKNRQRDTAKLNIECGLKLANCLNINIRTLLNN